MLKKSMAFLLVGLLAAVGGAWATDLAVVSSGAPDNDPNCVQEGNYGLRIRAFNGDRQAAFVQADAAQGFSDETVVRASFWYNPRLYAGPTGKQNFMLTALRSGGGKAPFRIVHFYNAGSNLHKLALACNVNCPGGVNCSNKRTDKVNLNPNAWHQIQIEWAHSDPAPTPANGVCTISVLSGPNSGQSSSVAGLRNTQPLVSGFKLGYMGNANIIPLSGAGDQCYDDVQTFRTLAP